MGRSLHYRRGVGSVLVAIAALLLAGWSASASSSVGPPVTISIWVGGAQPGLSAAIGEFEKLHPNIKVSLDPIPAANFITKVQLGVRSSSPPNLYQTFGGGLIFANFIADHLLVNLSTDLPDVQKDYIPTVLNPIMSGGQVYGVPFRGVEPEVIWYNKPALRRAGIKAPPKTWSALLSDVTILKQHGIIPFAQGSETWAEQEWPQYLTTRLGGKRFWTAVIDRKPGAWSNPALRKALDLTEQLLHADPFEPGYQGITWANGEPSKMLATGQAAMELQGAWELLYLQQLEPSFANSTDLGYFAFPSVPGDNGNATSVAGNNSEYLALTSRSPHRKEAEEFLRFLLGRQFTQILLQEGQVPGTLNGSSEIAAANLKPVVKQWITWCYNLVKAAPYFQPSWDQALPPALSTELTTDTGKLFAGTMTPQQYVADLNKQQSNAG